MYNPIQMNGYSTDEYLSEAVFTDGKKSLEPILNTIQNCKNVLLEEIQKVDDTTKLHAGNKAIEVYKFDPMKYWKNKIWKDLEDSIMKVFGFRYCEVNPYIERYSSKVNDFESRELNCAVYHADRFPIDGLVTDKGFYDDTHSTTMMIYITLGLIKDLESEEIMAVLLHEFGHTIDPALVTISYANTNILSKYLTDRIANATVAEKRALKDEEKKGKEINGKAKIPFFNIVGQLVHSLGQQHVNTFFSIFESKDKFEQKKLKAIREMMNKEKDEFNRQHYSEAFADNFARMYGYGSILMKALAKISKHTERMINESSWLKKEKARKLYITSMTIDAIKDVHKTDIHRVRSLIKEYKVDITDPTTPPQVKKYLESDLKELESVLELYLNDFSEFQNKVNRTINDALIEKESK